MLFNDKNRVCNQYISAWTLSCGEVKKAIAEVEYQEELNHD